MRIVAGALKGRRLDGPTWEGVRPTSDSLRETLFNVLAGVCDGARVLDAFAGTGAVGFEALSRGAAHVTFIDRDPRAIALITAHAERFGVAEQCAIMRGDLSRPRVLAPDARFDIVFLDPPYELDARDAALADAARHLAPGGRLILEHSRRRASPAAVPGAIRARVLEAGDSALSFYTAQEEA